MMVRSAKKNRKSILAVFFWLIRVWGLSGISREITGAGNRSRTYDLRITNALLYQLSYAGSKVGYLIRVFVGEQNHRA